MNDTAFWITGGIKRWTPKHRYMAQDISGYWFTYTTLPIQNIRNDWEGTEYCMMAHSELLPNQATLIIDLLELYETNKTTL